MDQAIVDKYLKAEANVKEIASQLGITPGAFYSYIHDNNLGKQRRSAKHRLAAEDGDMLVQMAIDVFSVDVRSPRRQRHIVKARQAVMVAMRWCGHSLPEIGASINRDHTTIIHGLKQAEKDNDIMLMAEALAERVGIEIPVRVKTLETVA